MYRNALYYPLVMLFLMAVLFGACQKEDSVVTEGNWLDYSCDTMAFDTVFTQMGTTTRQLMVYNRNDFDVKMRYVTLAGGRSSRFRLNVDGDTSLVAEDVRIAAGDSIFVFVRANINPNSQTEPFLIEDRIVFDFGGRQESIPLTAYGRNAVYHIPTDTLRDASGKPLINGMYGKPYAYSVIDCDGWRHDLPHVVLGYAVVDSRNTLRLQAGDEIYFADDAVLWVFDSATLVARGTAEQPVLFTSIRHDGWYDYLPGQWGHIWLYGGSRDNVIEHAVIENGFIGLLVDTNINGNPTLDISNSEIRNHTQAGIQSNSAYIVGDNLLVTNCGVSTLLLRYGGEYRFANSTFANYWRYETRKFPSVLITNYRTYANYLYLYGMHVRFDDCIIYGSMANELIADYDTTVSATLVLNHTLVKGGEWDEDPKFVDVANGDYRLKEGSPALGIGYTYPDAEAPNDKKLIR